MSRHPRRPGGFGRGPRIADRMTPEYVAFLECSLAAERTGDAATALEYHRGTPMFRRSAHAALLTQLLDVADEMTPWLWARWAAYQCTRAEDRGTDSAAIVHFSLDHALRTFHAEEMQALYDAHEDPAGFTGRTLGEDWAYHQICTFEMGGLDTFLDDLADGRLAAESGLAREWSDARMGGYLLERRDPLDVVAHDLADGRTTEVLDLGAGVTSGRFVLGRLVPSGTEPAWMFDTRPLEVDEPTARDAANRPERGGWTVALEDAVVDGRLPAEALLREDRELLTDVAGLDLLEAGTSPSALAATVASLRQGRDEVGRAAFRILRSVAEGSFGEEHRAPYVAAAVLNPHGYSEATRLLRTPGREWERWAGLVAEPARGRLERLARAGESAA